MPTPRIPLTGELAREPATCPALADNTGWKEVSQLFVCWKQAAGMNGEHVKALQWLWEK